MAAASASPSAAGARSTTTEPLSIAYYCTGHGLGHATRSIEVCKHLVERGHTVTVITGAPARVFFQEVPSTCFVLRKAVLDAGAKQLDPFTVDVRGSLELYHTTAVAHRDAMLAAEAQWLGSNHIDLVVSDVVPIVCAAAAAAGIPAVCVTNFSWDFIYSEYLTALRKSEFRQLVWQIAQDYSAAALLLRLPGYVPMPAFTAIEDVPLVVRHARKPPQQVREELGLPLDVRLAVLIHGGHKAELDVTQDFLPPGWVCVACNGGRPLSDAPLPPNFRLAPADVFTPDLVAASDCVVGKIGYGIVSECLAHKRPLVFVRRDFFNEEPFLRKTLEVHGAAIEMKRRDFLEGHWGPYLTRACAMTVTYDEPTNGAEIVAARLEQVGRGARPSPAGGAAALTRLRDTVVFGYLMASSKHGRVDVPEWYVNGADPNRRLGSSLSAGDALSHADGLLRDWLLLEGDAKLLPQLPDTLAFLQLLRGLEAPPGSSSSSGGGALSPSAAGAWARRGGADELPEVRAARVLFRWDADIIVTRAPGRLDVMGGIADYSGSLVLQMPVAEACHVALQRTRPGSAGTWRHVQARHAKLGGPRPTLQVVSFHADDTNRAPTFDLDLEDLYEPDGSPIPYASLRAYFASDPASAWGAYVAGCCLVLARARARPSPDSLALLVCSDVPEGKGVSSSAALEVAVMSAVAAAHGITLGGRELALLCQKAENLCVGAPCGVMDQMTAALGHAGQLTALLCQPAELQPSVQIPPQVRFWGIDSGIRHFVGGSDYRSVRVGAFMGLKLISHAAQRQAALLASTPAASVAALLTAVTSPHTRLARGSPAGSAASGGGGGSALGTPGSSAGGVGSSGAAEFHQQQQQHHASDFFGGGPPPPPPQLAPPPHAPAPAAEPPQPPQPPAPPLPGSPPRRTLSGGRPPCASFGGHLANISPSELQELYEAELPEQLLGAEFLATYGPHLDAATVVDPRTCYAVRQPTAHPVQENYRVNCFRALLLAADTLADATSALSQGSRVSLPGPQQLLGGSPGGSSADLGAAGPPGAAPPPAAGAAAGAAAAASDLHRLAISSGGSGSAAANGEAAVPPAAGGEPSSSASSEADAAGAGTSRSSSPFAGAPGAAAAAAADGGAAGGRAVPGAAGVVPAALLGPLEMLGELMFQSHASYSACGLGSDGTNRLVHIVREHMLAARKAGRPPALFGAKITGGGSGGTVCVLGLAGAAGQAAVDAVAAQYREETGYQPFVFAGSSMGAARFGHLRLRRRGTAGGA